MSTSLRSLILHDQANVDYFDYKSPDDTQPMLGVLTAEGIRQLVPYLMNFAFRLDGISLETLRDVEAPALKVYTYIPLTNQIVKKSVCDPEAHGGDSMMNFTSSETGKGKDKEPLKESSSKAKVSAKDGDDDCDLDADAEDEEEEEDGVEDDLEVVEAEKKKRKPKAKVQKAQSKGKPSGKKKAKKA